jgi:Flp pilus assembly protein TadD
LAIVYKGPLSIDQLLADRQRLDTPAADPRDVATPFRGKWLTEPFPPDLLSIASQLVGVRRGEAAYEYLTTHVLDAQSGAPLDPWRQLGVTANKVTGVLRNTAELLLAEDRASQAIELYGQAVRYEPNDWELHVRLADLLIRQQQSAEAIQVSQRMTQLKPNHPLPWNNIAWVLATSRDERVRDPKRAMELAERVSQATGQREPSALDTLAVAYAANGQFDDAVATAEKAIARCRELRLDELARTIATRLDGYRRHEAYRP